MKINPLLLATVVLSGLLIAHHVTPPRLTAKPSKHDCKKIAYAVVTDSLEQLDKYDSKAADFIVNRMNVEGTYGYIYAGCQKLENTR